jgi:hypothetical protein
MMGVSTNGILFWGYCFTEEEQKPYEHDDGEEDFDPETRYAERLGVVPPGECYSHENDAKWRAYWDAKKAANERGGCEVGYHCGDACPMYYVAVSASHAVAYRGDPRPIAPMAVGADWAGKLNDYCDKMGIRPPDGQQPGWWLTSYWG